MRSARTRALDVPPGTAERAECQSVVTLYLIFWAVETNEVRVIHIRHGARRPWRGL